MMFKNKSTYRQLAFMFGLLLVINFFIMIVTIRQLTIEPSAKQMALFFNMQLSSIEKLLEGKNLDEKKQIILKTFGSQQVVVKEQPNASDFPNLKFYRVLSQLILKNNSWPLKLEQSQKDSKIWIKPQWLDGQWLGIVFQPFINNVSRLLLIIIITLLSLSFVAAYFFSKYMLKPFKQLAQMAVDIVEQKPSDQHIRITGTKEVKEIAQLVQVSAEKIQQLNKEKELLLAGVSHDLRTPLARMRLEAEFMRDEEISHHLIQEIEEMDQIIGDFVTYVRSGTAEEVQLINLVEIINEVIDQFSKLGQAVSLDAKESYFLIKLKPLSFKRMLTNIIDNAFKYGLPPVEIKVVKKDKRIMIGILDHGKGLQKNELDRVFEPFIMANNTDNQFGSGLGLSIVKKLAQQNKAKVFAENHDQAGLCVWIEFYSTT